MMLTLDTASDWDVDDRTNPEQSIRGGSRYFASLLSRIPARISEPDRTWMAMASYNIGMGHLEDARVLTEQQGGNPDLWVDVKRRLPQLRQKSITAPPAMATREAMKRCNMLRIFVAITTA